jgi:hypothetical protein
MSVQPLAEFEREALLDAHRIRYHQLVQNSAVQERFLGEARARIEKLEKALRTNGIKVPE